MRFEKLLVNLKQIFKVKRRSQRILFWLKQLGFCIFVIFSYWLGIIQKEYGFIWKIEMFFEEVNNSWRLLVGCIFCS